MEARSQLRHRPTLKEGSATILAQQYSLVKHRWLCDHFQCSRNSLPEWKLSCQTCENEYSENEETNMNFTSRVACCGVLLLTASISFTQTASGNSATPVSYSSISELNQILGSLNQASQSTQNDLSRLRIEKWKTDGNTKRQTQSDADSILKNLQNALPGILTQLQNSPENLAATFKTYRNLDALYDVLSSVVESAGAFGGKEEFQALNNDLNSIDNSRHAVADRMDKLANAKETEIGQLRVALQEARAAIPPKKTVIDDTEPPKKTPAHKKPVPKPKAAQPATATTPKQ
jgi:hypothetical protein